MRQAPIALNKLLVLAEILELGSVSAAAQRLGRTQPSVSKTLSDLRAYYDDPLLVREGGRLTPTAFAQSLLAGLSQWRLEGEALLAMRSSFDPGRTERRFVVRASDYHHALFGALLAALTRTYAGVLSFDITRPVGSPEDDYPVAGFDIAFRVNALPGEAFEAREARREPYHIVYDPALRAPPGSLDEFCAAAFVLAAPAGSGPSAIDRYLAGLGRTRRIAIRTHLMLGAGTLLAGSEFLSVLPASVATATAQAAGLATAPLLFDVPDVVSHVIWPKLRATDPAILWLAEQIAEPQK